MCSRGGFDARPSRRKLPGTGAVTDALVALARDNPDKALVMKYIGQLVMHGYGDPPHEFFDAHLARQIALHIFAAQFDIPRRRVAAMTGIGRWTLRNAVMAVDSRLDEPVFEAAYRRMARRALNLFHDQIRRAAA